jgi:hypothetical protein
MNKLLLIIIFASTFACVVSAQTEQKSVCPTISVSGGGIPTPNEPITFTALLGDGIEKYNVKYKWTVNGGTIIEGQGTTQIKVLWQDFCDKNVTATLQVIGLPSYCPSMKSETGSVSDCFTRPIQFDEYGKLAFIKEKAKLNTFANEFTKIKNSNIYFLIYLTNKQKRAEINLRTAKIRKYLTETQKIAKDRIFFVFSESNIYLTKVYLVPFSSEPPMP